MRDRFPLWGSLQLIRESPYLKAIAWLIVISALTTTIAGWQFKAIAKASVPDTDELAMFFGTFSMIAGLMSLLLQLLLTGRLLRTIGVGSALFIVPTAMLMGSAGVLLLGTLVAAAALKASDQVLRYSIDKATVELLYLPVPASHTFRVKSFIDTVVYRFGDAAGGLVVLLFAAVLGLVAGADVDDRAGVHRRLDGHRLRGAAAVRGEPARKHPSASRRFRARVDAGARSRYAAS